MPSRAAGRGFRFLLLLIRNGWQEHARRMHPRPGLCGHRWAAVHPSPAPGNALYAITVIRDLLRSGVLTDDGWIDVLPGRDGADLS